MQLYGKQAASWWKAIKQEYERTLLLTFTWPGCKPRYHLALQGFWKWNGLRIESQSRVRTPAETASSWNTLLSRMITRAKTNVKLWNTRIYLQDQHVLQAFQTDHQLVQKLQHSQIQHRLPQNIQNLAELFNMRTAGNRTCHLRYSFDMETNAVGNKQICQPINSRIMIAWLTMNSAAKWRKKWLAII